jgi:hypothetical protein
MSFEGEYIERGLHPIYSSISQEFVLLIHGYSQNHGKEIISLKERKKERNVVFLII